MLHCVALKKNQFSILVCHSLMNALTLLSGAHTKYNITGKMVAKFYAKHLGMQFFRNEACSSGDLASSCLEKCHRVFNM
uniref:Uncharacterized protein n=1 Tax=Aegilops tauschii subsp. strangulata TaxID=200361 RepID=A0A453HWJ7_AEGTS